MGLGQLQCSQIVLKRISFRHGILGIDKLLRFLIQEWLQDIKKRQLPKILGGVGPMYSFIQLCKFLINAFGGGLNTQITNLNLLQSKEFSTFFGYQSSSIKRTDELFVAFNEVLKVSPPEPL